jgi:mono/diheme cytochrome c family protein
MTRALALALLAPALLALPATASAQGIAARRGLAFAQQRCAACHGVTADASSPNPESPPFDDIANRPGVTRATLQEFLRDSHNYPAAMSFTVPPASIRDLAAYLTTLRKSGYKPAR